MINERSDLGGVREVQCIVHNSTMSVCPCFPKARSSLSWKNDEVCCPPSSKWPHDRAGGARAMKVCQFAQIPKQPKVDVRESLLPLHMTLLAIHATSGKDVSLSASLRKAWLRQRITMWLLLCAKFVGEKNIKRPLSLFAACSFRSVLYSCLSFQMASYGHGTGKCNAQSAKSCRAKDSQGNSWRR